MRRRPRRSAKDVLAENLKYLLTKEDISARTLAKKCAIADKTVGNIINARTSCTVDIADKLAHYFGLELWQLAMPDLPDKIESIQSVPALTNLYNEANVEGRKLIMMIAEREARYATSDHPET